MKNIETMKKVKCPNCSGEHKTRDNWYCGKCSMSLRKLTGIGYLDVSGFKGESQ